MRDFTLRKYVELCNAIQVNHEPVTVLEYLENPPGNAAVIRHDVDNQPKRSLCMAEIENKLGVTSTYYFRTVPNVFKRDIMLRIKDLNHEIGFHYEVLDKAKGDYTKAIQLFQKELEQFPCEIKTICMHGNPLTPWDNRELWKMYDLSDYGILGEAYLSIDYSDLFYFSDTGRTWDGKYSVKDVITVKRPKIKVKGTQGLIDFFNESDQKAYITTHPQRWDDSILPWARELFLQSLKNIGKNTIKYMRSRGNR